MARKIERINPVIPISHKQISHQQSDSNTTQKPLYGEVLKNESHEKSSDDTRNPQSNSTADPQADHTMDSEEHHGETLHSSQNEQRLFHFDIDYSHGEPVVNVVDAQSQQLIRQIPFSELHSIKEKIANRVGIFIDSKI